jgi:non-heme chloroperoxidase
LMGTITTSDGTQILYKDWGTGQPVIFSHGWPLNADAWDDQAMLVANNGYRAIAHDRRGHGRSSQPWDGNDLRRGRGHPLPGPPRHHPGRQGGAGGRDPAADAQDPSQSRGHPLEAFDAIRQGVAGDRSQFYQDLSEPFYGANRPGTGVSRGVRDAFWLWSMQVGLKGAHDCVKAFSETDLTEDLGRIDVPTLIVHGDDDQIVPISASALKSSKLVKDATLKVYPGAPMACSPPTRTSSTPTCSPSSGPEPPASSQPDLSAPVCVRCREGRAAQEL